MHAPFSLFFFAKCLTVQPQRELRKHKHWFHNSECLHTGTQCQRCSHLWGNRSCGCNRQSVPISYIRREGSIASATHSKSQSKFNWQPPLTWLPYPQHAEQCVTMSWLCKISFRGSEHSIHNNNQRCSTSRAGQSIGHGNTHAALCRYRRVIHFVPAWKHCTIGCYCDSPTSSTCHTPFNCFNMCSWLVRIFCTASMHT